jgi:hypothetical protein
MKTLEEKIKEFNAKRESKISKYKELAEKNINLANSFEKKAKSIQSAIPLGQPILVGHHSERRHRNDLKRIDNTYQKCFDSLNKAKYYKQKALNTQSNNAVFIDDPDAQNKLIEQISADTKLLEEYKTIRKSFKKTKDFSVIPEHLKEHCKTYLRCNGEPVPSYAITNLSANIKRLQTRLKTISKANTLDGLHEKHALGEILLSDGYWKIVFPSIPPPELRQKLKSYPISLKYSPTQKAWIRKFSDSTGQYFKTELVKVLSDANSQTT